jgi:hypothetical protein
MKSIFKVIILAHSLIFNSLKYRKDYQKKCVAGTKYLSSNLETEAAFSSEIYLPKYTA